MTQSKVPTPIDSLRLAVEARKNTWAAVLPKHCSPERFARSIIVACAKSPALLNADRSSLFLAAQTAAQLGLDCSGVLGSAYLIPYGKTVTLIIGYRGLIDLARRSREITSISAHVVHEGDTFNVSLGTSPCIEHTPAILSEDRGSIVAAYAVATLSGGGVQFEVMTTQEIDAIRKRSRSGTAGPWVSDWSEMARKTVLRRLAKYLPLTPEMADAMNMESHQEEKGEIIDVQTSDMTETNNDQTKQE